MRAFVPEGLVRPVPETAPGPIGERLQASRVIQTDGRPGYEIWPPRRTLTPVGRWLTPIGTDLRWAQADDVGRYPVGPDLMGFKNPVMPGNPPEGAFPDPVLGWSLERLEASRTAPGAWAINRDRFYSRSDDLLPRAPAYRMGRVAPNIVGGDAFGLTEGSEERLAGAGRQAASGLGAVVAILGMGLAVWWGMKA